MDVDLAELGRGRLSEAEWKKLQTEGRCFFCKAQGHMSRQCPKKGGHTRNTQNSACPRPVAAQTTEINEDAPINANTVAATLVRLKLAFCTTCAVRVLVLAQGPSFLRLRRALLRRKGIHKMRGIRRSLWKEWRQSRRSCSTSTEESEVVWKW